MGLMKSITNALERIRTSNAVEDVIFDEFHKLTDWTNILNITIADLCQNVDIKTYQEILNQLREDQNKKARQLNEVLQQNLDENSKKQYETQLKNVQSFKKTLFRGEMLLNSNHNLNEFILAYDNRIKKEQFIQDGKFIDLLSFFGINSDFSLDDLNKAKERKENEVYTLTDNNEKNKLIDCINRYYEILSDPIRKKAYFDIQKNPEIANILDAKIEEIKEKKKMPKQEKETTTTTSFENPKQETEESKTQEMTTTTENELPRVEPPIHNQIEEKPMETLESPELPPWDVVPTPKEEQLDPPPWDIVTPPKEEKPPIDYIPISNMKVNRKIPHSTVQRYHSIQNIKEENGLEYMVMTNRQTEQNRLQEQLENLTNYQQKIEELLIPSLKEINKNLITYQQQTDAKSRQMYALNMVAKETLLKYNMKKLMQDEKYVAIKEKIDQINKVMQQNQMANIISLENGTPENTRQSK